MLSIVNNNNIYDTILISKIKKQTGPQKLKKILKNLRNYVEEDLKCSSELKIKIFEVEKHEDKKYEILISAPIFGFQHYVEDFKKSYLKKIVNNAINNEGGNTLSTVDNNEEESKQIDSSDFSQDE